MRGLALTAFVIVAPPGRRDRRRAGGTGKRNLSSTAAVQVNIRSSPLARRTRQRPVPGPQRVRAARPLASQAYPGTAAASAGGRRAARAGLGGNLAGADVPGAGMPDGPGAALRLRRSRRGKSQRNGGGLVNQDVVTDASGIAGATIELMRAGRRALAGLAGDDPVAAVDVARAALGPPGGCWR